MSLTRWATRRDGTEREIVDALRSVGADVWRLSGKGLPDVLARFRGTLYAFEVKTATGKRTAAQKASQWAIVRTVEEALRAVGAGAKS